jgi:hypothetical protein
MVRSLKIDDLVVLGHAAPDRLKDRRTSVCTAGWSPTLGFVRIFPVPFNAGVRRWDVISLAVERDANDTRDESWKIQDAKRHWGNIDKIVKVVGKIKRSERLPLVQKLTTDCVECINIAKDSLGIILPETIEGYLRTREDYAPTMQRDLNGKLMPKTKKDYPIQPRVKYRCSRCITEGSHDQQLLEWGAYEWIRKSPERAHELWENLHLYDSEWVKYLFVGNLRLYRTSFVVISILRFRT